MLRLCNLSLSHPGEKSLQCKHEAQRGYTVQKCSKGKARALSNYSSVQWENWILCRDKGRMCLCFQQRKGRFGLLPSFCVNTRLCPWWPQQACLSTASEKQPPGHSIPHQVICTEASCLNCNHSCFSYVLSFEIDLYILAHLWDWLELFTVSKRGSGYPAMLHVV